VGFPLRTYLTLVDASRRRYAKGCRAQGKLDGVEGSQQARQRWGTAVASRRTSRGQPRRTLCAARGGLKATSFGGRCRVKELEEFLSQDGRVVFFLGRLGVFCGPDQSREHMLSSLQLQELTRCCALFKCVAGKGGAAAALLADILGLCCFSSFVFRIRIDVGLLRLQHQSAFMRGGFFFSLVNS
jgi:hypothetical protein